MTKAKLITKRRYKVITKKCEQCGNKFEGTKRAKFCLVCRKGTRSYAYAFNGKQYESFNQTHHFGINGRQHK